MQRGEVAGYLAHTTKIGLRNGAVWSAEDLIITGEHESLCEALLLKMCLRTCFQYCVLCCISQTLKGLSVSHD